MQLRLTATKKYVAIVDIANELSDIPIGHALGVDLGIKTLIEKIEAELSP